MGLKYSREKAFDQSVADRANVDGLPAIRRLSLFSTSLRREPQISDRQRQLLLDSFATLKHNISQIGVLLFIGLFETHPEVQGFFGELKDCPPEMLAQNKQLRQHALRVMGFVEKCISRINTPERLDAIIRQLGRHHANYGTPPTYVSFVGPQFINAIRMSLEPRWDEETENAWLALFAYIAYGMKKAMAATSNPELLTPTTE